MSSYSFFNDVFLPQISYEDLMAFSHWSEDTNFNVYDTDKFNPATKEWISDDGLNTPPSTQKAFKKFKTLFSVSVDKKTSFVKLTIDHPSPHVAKAWILTIINEINKLFKEKDSIESSLAISFLNNQISQTNLAEVKIVLAQMIQQHTQKLMLAESAEEYIFKVLDPPYAAEARLKPRRAIICIIGTILGGFLGIILSLALAYLDKFIKRFKHQT